MIKLVKNTEINLYLCRLRIMLVTRIGERTASSARTLGKLQNYMQSAETWPLSFVIYKIKIIIIQSSNEELLIEMSLGFPYPNR